MTFYVCETSGPNILGLQACTALGLVKVYCEVNAEAKSQAFSSKSISDIHEDYPDQFGGIGSFPAHFHITLKDDANPVVHATRKYPVHLQKELKEELDRMESLEVISKVTQPTDWVNSLAFSRKQNGKLRVCLDPKDLNKAIKRTYHKTPTLEEISHKFSGAKFFSKMDAQHGYWAIHLDDKSNLLTTFNSPFGRYRFLRLPFGLKVSQDIFQQKMDQILEECPGTLGISDDICVFGATEEEHDRNLRNLMEVSKKRGLVFNKDKCHIKKDRINFYGLIWDSKGAHPDPKKMRQHNKEAITNECDRTAAIPWSCPIYEPIHTKLE
ncbi:Pol polyprotein [Plakobranchus ocellatus]|uniref:Pol polyprotein n=1 Tax=Plakobranchus ocellatus TaxID=259542 RepID=A0AAV4D0P1_9GAST|nr:Pol polyprotein [Plakobranchus ocellatus]